MSSALPTLGVLAAIAGRLAWSNRHWLRRRPTDWNAVRESLGYRAQSNRVAREGKPPARRRSWRERLTGVSIGMLSADGSATA